MTFLIGAVRNWEPQSNHKGKLPTQPATRNKNEIKTNRPQGQIFITPGRGSCRAGIATNREDDTVIRACLRRSGSPYLPFWITKRRDPGVMGSTAPDDRR